MFDKADLEMIEYLTNKQIDLIHSAEMDMDEDVPKENIRAYRAKYETLLEKVRKM